MRKSVKGILFIAILIGISTLVYIAGRSLTKEEIDPARSYSRQGTAYFKEDNYQEAISSFKKALELDPKNKIIKQYLSTLLVKTGSDYLEKKDYQQAGIVLKEALKYDKNNPDTYIFLGDIKYNTQRLQEAKEYWQKARLLAPDSEVVNERFSILDKQYDLERKFKSREYGSFTVAFKDSLKAIGSYSMRNLLWEAYRKVGQDFAYFPDSKVIILFYPHDEYMRMTGYGEAVMGHYDGKIRLPILKDKEQPKDYQAAIWHEYTHAIIHILCPERVPIWLNEGLALYEENKAKPLDLRRLKKSVRNNALLPISQLSRYLSSFDKPDKTQLAYQESFSLADYLIQRYSFWHIKNVLLELSKGDKDFDQILREQLYVSLSQLEKNWMKYVEKKYR